MNNVVAFECLTEALLPGTYWHASAVSGKFQVFFAVGTNTTCISRPTEVTVQHTLDTFLIVNDTPGQKQDMRTPIFQDYIVPIPPHFICKKLTKEKFNFYKNFYKTNPLTE